MELLSNQAASSAAAAAVLAETLATFGGMNQYFAEGLPQQFGEKYVKRSEGS